MDTLIYVDTHVLVWLELGDPSRIPPTLTALLERGGVRVSPAVGLELQLLHEIGRLRPTAPEVLARARAHLDLRVVELPFERIATRAWELAWTRDPFDRLIAATALAEDLPLYTADRRMLAQCQVATWS